MGNICRPINFFQPGSDELFVGRAGYLCGSLILNKKLGRTVVSSEVTRPIFDAIIVSGQQYSQRYRSKSPLMYSYYRTEYLGKCWVQSVRFVFAWLLTIFPSFPPIVIASHSNYINFAVQPMYIVSRLKSGVHKIFQRIPITLDFYKLIGNQPGIKNKKKQ